MGADRWGVCPKCQENLKSSTFDLNEYYGFYLYGYILEIEYRCQCTECDFTFHYKQTVDMRSNEKAMRG